MLNLVKSMITWGLGPTDINHDSSFVHASLRSPRLKCQCPPGPVKCGSLNLGSACVLESLMEVFKCWCWGPTQTLILNEIHNVQILFLLWLKLYLPRIPFYLFILGIQIPHMLNNDKAWLETRFGSQSKIILLDSSSRHRCRNCSLIDASPGSGPGQVAEPITCMAEEIPQQWAR